MRTKITTNATTIASLCCYSDKYIANAVPEQTVLEETTIALKNDERIEGSNIGNTANYLWKEIADHVVAFYGNNTLHLTFLAPNCSTNMTYTFALEVFDHIINNNNNNNNNNKTGSL